MYCKHCGTQLADWQKTCHICGTPVDSDAKKTFLDDIDFSETEELSDAIEHRMHHHTMKKMIYLKLRIYQAWLIQRFLKKIKLWNLRT